MSEILKCCQGYVIVFAKGPYMERFFQQCAKRGLLLWNIEANNDGYTFMVYKKSYGIVSDLAKATGSNLSILKKIGLPFFLHQYRKRKMFVLCCLASLIMLYIFSLFLWDVTIDGASTYSDQEILDYVTTQCVHVGDPLKRIDCVLLEEMVRTQFPKMAWVSCELKGTQLVIHIKEMIPLKEHQDKIVPSDLVAVKDATISKIVMREGTLQVKVGQYVKSNDLLVSGKIEYHDDAGEVMKTSYLAADADVIAKTKYNYCDQLEYVQYKKEYINENKYSFYLHLGNRKICVLPTVKSKNKKEFDDQSKFYKFKLGKTFYFPIQIERLVKKPYILKRVEYTKDQLKKEAQKHLKEYCDNLSQKGVEIIGNNVTIKDVDGKLVASGSVFTLESIGKRKNINFKNKHNKKAGKTDDKYKENVNERSGKTTERSE